MDEYISLLMPMDHDSLVLTLKLLALAVVLGLACGEFMCGSMSPKETSAASGPRTTCAATGNA